MDRGTVSNTLFGWGSRNFYLFGSLFMEMMGVSSFHTFQAARTDWAVWRLMHWASLLQRAHPDEIWPLDAS